jgi:hypothetical protein
MGIKIGCATLWAMLGISGTGVLVVCPQSSGILFRGYYAGDEAAYYKWAPNTYSHLRLLDKWTQAPFTRDP